MAELGVLGNEMGLVFHLHIAWAELRIDHLLEMSWQGSRTRTP